MPRVFISYSRHDLSAAQQFEHALQAQGIATWRDQESIYGGQQWPKAIGEAIAAHDYVLLVWSKSAAQWEHSLFFRTQHPALHVRRGSLGGPFWCWRLTAPR